MVASSRYRDSFRTKSSKAAVMTTRVARGTSCVSIASRILRICDLPHVVLEKDDVPDAVEVVRECTQHVPRPREANPRHGAKGQAALFVEASRYVEL